MSDILPPTSRIRRAVGRAIADFRMISPGDRILVGLSGGKDSAVLLVALAALRKVSPVPFSLTACTIDPSGGAFDPTPLAFLCTTLGVPFVPVTTDIFGIIEKRQERSPCSFCATMRRGILCSTARQYACNLVALGHHLDDVVETVFLNLFSGGRFRSFRPKLWHSRMEITVIRPLVYLEERYISAEAARLALPLSSPACPHGTETERSRIKDFVSRTLPEFPSLKSNILHALTHARAADIWKTESETDAARDDEI